MLTFAMGNKGRKTKKRRKNGVNISPFVRTAAVSGTSRPQTFMKFLEVVVLPKITLAS